MTIISPFCPKKYPKIRDFKGLNIFTFNVGLRKKNKDLMVIIFNRIANVSGVTTQSSIVAAPVLWVRKILKFGKCKVLIVNSGIANAFTGRKGMKTIKENVDFSSKKFNCKKNEVYISSTGVIGEYLSSNKINNAIETIGKIKNSNFLDAANAIMTTDTFPKIERIQLKHSKIKIDIVGIAKGSGMIMPNMATMLSYIFINLPISKKMLDLIMSESVEDSFNSITVDGDTSTNDTVLLFSILDKKNKVLSKKSDPRFKLIKESVKKIMQNLAKKIVLDGEGISKFITINIKKAKSSKQADNIARSIACSSLVKTAIFGEDPNWGRIIAAIGKSNEKIDPSKIVLKIGKHLVCQNGALKKNYKEKYVKNYMKNDKIDININLGIGNSYKRFWTSDLTKKYIEINADYRT